MLVSVCTKLACRTSVFKYDCDMCIISYCSNNYNSEYGNFHNLVSSKSDQRVKGQSSLFGPSLFCESEESSGLVCGFAPSVEDWSDWF